ncbi:MAG: S41 family peptidase, partial [Candidatus Kryptoniota bacterium]
KYQVSNEMLNRVISLARSKGVKVSQQDFQSQEKYVAMLIKAQIARNLWGNEGWYRVVLGMDDQFLKAMSLFPEAEKIAGLN